MSATRHNVYLIIALICLVILNPEKTPAQAIDASSIIKPDTTDWQSLEVTEFPTNQIILKYKATQALNSLPAAAQLAQLERLSEAGGVSLAFVRQMSGEAQVLRLPERLPADQVNRIAQRLTALPEVEYAEADAILQSTLAPNDPSYSNQWHYFTPGTGHYGINAPAAWDITTGSANVVVAVIDTGFTNHADLSGRTVPGYDFIGDVAVANDGDGRDSDPSDPGDWITSAESSSGYFLGCQVRDSSWHGTHTAGTIGAASNNGAGVAGVNWTSKVLSVRVLGKCGGYTSDIADAMRWSAGLSVTGVPNNTNPAKVLNLSLGGQHACDATTQNAINTVTATGATVVVSAGNSNANASGFSPASCNGVITVAATNKDGSRAYYSNYGSTVEISGPGGEQAFANDPNGVLSTLNTGTQGPVADTFVYYQGTSMAAPHVSGVASLLYSLDPTLTPAEILSVLQSTVTDFPSGSSCSTSNCGSGIVNAGAAVAELVVTPTNTPTAKLTDTSTPTYTPDPPATSTPTPTFTGTPITAPTSTATNMLTDTPLPPATQPFATPTAMATPFNGSHTLYLTLILR